MDGGEEVPCGLVVTGGDAAELLELGEEVLDQMACFVEISVVIAGRLPVRLGRDHCGLASSSERHDDPLSGVECLIGDQRVGLHRGQQMIGANEVVSLSTGQEKADWIAESIDQRMDLGAQSAAGSPDRLVLAGFFWAPALC